MVKAGVGGVAGDDLGAGDAAAAAAVHGNDVVAEGEELFDERAADLAGAEDDMAGHDALAAFRVRTSGRTAVRAVTTSGAAGAEDDELLVDRDADGGGDDPAERPDDRQCGRPDENQPAEAAPEHEGLRNADGQPADGALHGQRSKAGVVVHDRRADPESGHEPDGGGRDPLEGGRPAATHCPGLRGAENGAGDQAADQRSGQIVHRADDQRWRLTRRAGSPRNDTIQRAVVRSVDWRVVAADGAIVTSDMVTPTGGGGWAGWNGGAWPAIQAARMLSGKSERCSRTSTSRTSAFVVQVSGGHGDELAVPGRDGVLRCPGQQSVRFCR